MGISSYLSEDKQRKTSKAINTNVCKEIKEEKYDSPDINKKILIKNDNHSNNTSIIIKAKKRIKLEI